MAPRRDRDRELDDEACAARRQEGECPVLTPAPDTPLRPSSWSMMTWIMAIGMVTTLVLWAFDTGGSAAEVSARIAAVEKHAADQDAVYMRRDVLDEQMKALIESVNELRTEVRGMARDKGKGAPDGGGGTPPAGRLR